MTLSFNVVTSPNVYSDREGHFRMPPRNFFKTPEILVSELPIRYARVQRLMKLELYLTLILVLISDKTVVLIIVLLGTILI